MRILHFKVDSLIPHQILQKKTYMGFPLGESLKCLSNWPSIFEAIIYIFSNMIFILLDFIKVHKKQKFSALDNVESRSKEIFSVSYVTSFEMIVRVSLS